MNVKLLNFICCPVCSNKLSLEKEKELDNGEIITGKLFCKCGKRYPIVHGVPIILTNLKKDMQKIKKTFSKEWKAHKYKETKTWRLKTSERKSFFCKQMGIKNPDILKNKTLLDAGCGNGELTVLLSDYGFDNVIGIDISDSIFSAYMNNPKKDKVFFIQGDLMNPPFKKQTFDYIYSDGVVHHTPDTRYTFSQIAKLTKTNGRFWAWIYLKREYTKYNKLYLFAVDNIGLVISKCPLFMQDLIIYTVALPMATFLQWIGIIKTKDNWTEKEILIRDGFTHIYVNKHTPKEVDGWFKENGFEDIVLSDTRQLAGFGMYGIKK